MLRICAAYCEADADPAESARSLAVELRALADWLGLERVRVMRSKGFDRELGKRLA